jgi:UDP-glucose 4-epimerase
MNILLTGSDGNFGRELIRQADCSIIPCSRGDWDSLDAKLAGGIDVVIHAASDLRTGVAASPVGLMDSNLMTTARLLEAVRKHGISRFFFLSSCAVYGEDMRTGEEEKCCPIGVNGIGKLLNEKIVAEFCAAHEIQFAILRIFNMYGGNDHFSVISQMQRALTMGHPFTLNNEGKAQRDFIHVSDVAKIVLRLSDMNVPYTHINVGTGVATKISTLIELVTARYPELAIRHAKVVEAEYSRADISRLLNLINMDFIKIEEYIDKNFMGHR